MVYYSIISFFRSKDNEEKSSLGKSSAKRHRQRAVYLLEGRCLEPGEEHLRVSDRTQCIKIDYGCQ